jgi:hypothetical protein
MNSLTIDDAYRDLLRITNPSEIIGCTASEIEEVRLSQEVALLPSFYADFLRVMGKRAGRLFYDIDIYYPNILGLKKYANELLQGPFARASVRVFDV